MILLNAGIPFIFVEYPTMIFMLVFVITLEFYLLRPVDIKLALVIWSNVLSTIIGIPISILARILLGHAFDDGKTPNIFMASVSDPYDYNGFDGWVYLVIIGFDYVVSVLTEFFFYRWRNKVVPRKQLFWRTAFANLISYILIVVWAYFFLFRHILF